MKAWELFKQLEEGGEIESFDGVDKGNIYNFASLYDNEAIYYIYSNPNTYKLVKPKKKIKLYRYTYTLDSAVVNQTGWSTCPSKGKHLEKVLMTEEKEIEVEDDKA